MNFSLSALMHNALLLPLNFTLEKRKEFFKSKDDDDVHQKFSLRSLDYKLKAMHGFLRGKREFFSSSEFPSTPFGPSCSIRFSGMVVLGLRRHAPRLVPRFVGA